jgi:hypothetical protein
MSTPPEGDYNSRNRSISAELLNNPPDQTERRVNPIDYSGTGHRERVNALCAEAPVTRPKLRAEAVEVRGEPVDMVRPKVPFQPIEQMPAQLPIIRVGEIGNGVSTLILGAWHPHHLEDNAPLEAQPEQLLSYLGHGSHSGPLPDHRQQVLVVNLDPHSAVCTLSQKGLDGA